MTHLLLKDAKIDNSLSLSFLAKQKPEYKCCICYDFAEKPAYMSCGHIFCISCVSKQNTNVCAMCKTPFGEVKLNDVLFKIISRIEFSCKFESRGCTRKFNLKECRSHLMECGFKKTKCIYCQVSIFKKDKKEHEENCESRPMTCPACLENIPFNQFKEHVSVSTSVSAYLPPSAISSSIISEPYCTNMIECPNKCYSWILEKKATMNWVPHRFFVSSKMKTHLSVCPLETVTCDYCKQQIKRYELESHFEIPESQIKSKKTKEDDMSIEKESRTRSELGTETETEPGFGTLKDSETNEEDQGPSKKPKWNSSSSSSFDIKDAEMKPEKDEKDIKSESIHNLHIQGMLNKISLLKKEKICLEEEKIKLSDQLQQKHGFLDTQEEIQKYIKEQKIILAQDETGIWAKAQIIGFIPPRSIQITFPKFSSVWNCFIHLDSESYRVCEFKPNALPFFNPECIRECDVKHNFKIQDFVWAAYSLNGANGQHFCIGKIQDQYGPFLCVEHKKTEKLHYERYYHFLEVHHYNPQDPSSLPLQTFQTSTSSSLSSLSSSSITQIPISRPSSVLSFIQSLSDVPFVPPHPISRTSRTEAQILSVLGSILSSTPSSSSSRNSSDQPDLLHFTIPGTTSITSSTSTPPSSPSSTPSSPSSPPSASSPLLPSLQQGGQQSLQSSSLASSAPVLPRSIEYVEQFIRECGVSPLELFHLTNDRQFTGRP